MSLEAWMFTSGDFSLAASSHKYSITEAAYFITLPLPPLSFWVIKAIAAPALRRDRPSVFISERIRSVHSKTV
jgi:hypothetical protein